MRRRVIGLIKLAWLILVAVGLWWFLKTYDLRVLLDGQNLATSSLAVICVMVSHAGVILTQGEAIRANGPATNLHTNARIFNLTNMSKYIPVSGANLVVNGVMIRSLGHSVKGATSALLLLTYWTILGACIFGAAAAGTLIGLPFLLSAVLGFLGGAVAFALRPERFVGITGAYRLPIVVIGQMLIWIGYGAAFALILMNGGETAQQLWLYGSAYDLSFGAGMLAIFAPSGVGVREAITALVVEGKEPAMILAATIYLRALILIADLLVYFTFWIWGRVKLSNKDLSAQNDLP